jgi:hypothetical protein
MPVSVTHYCPHVSILIQRVRLYINVRTIPDINYSSHISYLLVKCLMFYLITDITKAPYTPSVKLSDFTVDIIPDERNEKTAQF